MDNFTFSTPRICQGYTQYVLFGDQSFSINKNPRPHSHVGGATNTLT